MARVHDGNNRRAGHWLERHSVRAALVALGVLGTLVFIVRGPVPALRATGNSDFALVWTCARVWIAGGDPYDLRVAGAEWDRSGEPAVWHITQRGPVLLYPPSTFVVAAPLAALPFRIAAAVWTILNLVAGAAAGWAVGRVAGLPRRLWLPYSVGAVWLAPFATAVWLGQTPVVVLGLLALGELARVKGRAWVSGLLLGLGSAIKPQVGALFVVYELGRGRWRSVAAALAVGAALLAAGVARLEMAGVPWRASWGQMLHDFRTSGDADPSRANPNRYQILDLSAPLHWFTDDRLLVRALVWGIVGAICLAYLLVDRRRAGRRGEAPGEIVSLSMTAVVTLLVVYHRSYDAVLLVFPLALGMRMAGSAVRADRTRGWVLLALMLPFAFPGMTVLTQLKNAGRLPEWLAQSTLWNAFVVPHATWALLAMAVWLVWVRARTARETLG